MIEEQSLAQVQVPRACLQRVFDRIRSVDRGSCTELLIGGGGSGKSMAGRHLGRLAKSAGRAVAFVDLRMVCKGLEPSKTWNAVLSDAGEQLFGASRRSRMTVTAKEDDDFVELFRNLILNRIDEGTCTIILDNIDSMLDTMMEQTFYVNLRFAHNYRAEDPRAGAVDWIFTTTAPEDFLNRSIDNLAESIFAMATKSVVRDFSIEEVRALNHAYEDKIDESSVRRLWEVLGGIPWLTERVLRDLPVREKLPEKLTEIPWVRQHLEETRERLSEGHLTPLLRRAKNGVLGYESIREEAKLLELLRLGVVHCNSADGALVRNSLYQGLAKRKWWGR